MRKQIGVTLMFLFLATAVDAPAQEGARKVRLAVMPFKNVATSIPQGEDVGRAVADMLITELFKLKRYELIERSQLDKLIAERNLQQSDLAESSAREMAKILKCDALVVGSISQYAESRMDRNFAFYRKEKATYTVGIEFRILDTETGATRLAESAVGSVEKEGRVGGLLSGKTQEEGKPEDGAVMPGQGISGGYGEAARAAVDVLIAKLRAAFPLEGYVADVEGDAISINLGRSDNVSVGDRFKVVDVGKEIIDPVTKEKLGSKTQDVGEITIREVVGDRLSTGQAVSVSGKIAVGNKVIAISLKAAQGEAQAVSEPRKEDKKSKRRHHDDDDDDDDKDKK